MTDSVLAEIKKERIRQIEIEGRTRESDDDYAPGVLARAGASYGLSSASYITDENGNDATDNEHFQASLNVWPWRGPHGAAQGWNSKDARRDLIRGAALFVAAIEKIDRE